MEYLGFSNTPTLRCSVMPLARIFFQFSAFWCLLRTVLVSLCAAAVSGCHSSNSIGFPFGLLGSGNISGGGWLKHLARQSCMPRFPSLVARWRVPSLSGRRSQAMRKHCFPVLWPLSEMPLSIATIPGLCWLSQPVNVCIISLTALFTAGCRFPALRWGRRRLPALANP